MAPFSFTAPTCVGFSGCVSPQVLMDSPSSKTCAAAVCTPSECCVNRTLFLLSCCFFLSLTSVSAAGCSFSVLWQEMLRICAFFPRVSKDSFSHFFRIGVLKKLCIRHPSAINVVGGQVCVTRRATTNNTSKARRTPLNRPTLGPRWMICTFYMWGWHRARSTCLGASENRFYLFFRCF